MSGSVGYGRWRRLGHSHPLGGSHASHLEGCCSPPVLRGPGHVIGIPVSPHDSALWASESGHGDVAHAVAVSGVPWES